MKKVIVYTKNNCPECEKVKFNLPHLPAEKTVEYRNIDEYAAHHLALTQLGYQSVPVTIVEGHEPIVGFEIGELQNAFGI
ncbi:glutaredoxin family protein [Bacillus toyonensis]|uniref:glutaredoxin family protein n=1 Tax=Bacillus toyonensis TaxID=155322 RepID=UPI000BF08AC1|nr:glutaredoxin family protein [Bacillus toyonensis]PEM64414.1 NrdH-redoxin [Bacillus toyonensis]